MIKNRILIRLIFLTATVAVLGTAFALAKQSGLLDGGQNIPPAITDPWKILEQIHRYYDRDSAFGQTYDITLYNDKEPGNILEQYDCVFYSGKDQVYSRLGTDETYCNKDLLIRADLTNKVVELMDAQPELITSKLPALKELKKRADDLKGRLTIIEENGKQVLAFKNEFDTEIKSYRVYFDPYTWAITSVKIEVWKEEAYRQEEPESLTMKISFGPLKTLDLFPEEFGRSRFLQLKSDTLTLQPDYMDFEFINQHGLPRK
jgi:hypothetical protein